MARLFSAPFRWLFGLFFSRVHGDARWMNRREMRRLMSPKNTGLVFSNRYRLSQRDSFTNLVLVAPTGSGKTTRYVIPNVLRAEGSVVVTDPAGEIHRSTSSHLHRRGFVTRVLRPADVGRSERFNPLDHWRSPQALRELATILGANVQGLNSDPFWSTSAINLLWIGLAAINNTKSEYRNLVNLRWLLNHVGSHDSTGLDRFMEEHLRDPQALSEYRAFKVQDSRVLSSVVATARAAVELWSDTEICSLTSSNTIDLEQIRHQRTAIYLIVPEHQVRYFGPLLNLFYSACFAQCLKGASATDEPVYFFLDEFGNLGPIPNFGSVITTLRKRRCSVSIILQELSQLRGVYGPDQARTIFSGGCANKLFFSGLDLETAQYVEQVLGQNTEYDTTFGGVAQHARTIGVPLLRADEVRRMPADQAILFSGRQRPVRVATEPFFENDRLAGLARWRPAEAPHRPKGESVALLNLDGNANDFGSGSLAPSRFKPSSTP